MTEEGPDARLSLAPLTGEQAMRALLGNGEPILFKREDPARWDYFACRCSPQGKAEVERVWRKAEMFYAQGSRDMGGAGGELHPSSLFTDLAYAFEIDFNATIGELYADQWFGFHVKSDDFIASVQCDQLEDGLVACWVMFCERFGRPAP